MWAGLRPPWSEALLEWFGPCTTSAGMDIRSCRDPGVASSAAYAFTEALNGHASEVSTPGGRPSTRCGARVNDRHTTSPAPNGTGLGSQARGPLGLFATTCEEATVTIAGVAGREAGRFDLGGRGSHGGQFLPNVAPVLHPARLVVRVGGVEEPLGVLAGEAADRVGVSAHPGLVDVPGAAVALGLTGACHGGAKEDECSGERRGGEC